MTGNERRKKILEYIKKSDAPVSGTKLAELLGVSRQIVVQDIALIRAGGDDVVSTHKGYILQAASVCGRVFQVNHTDEQLEEELCMIVDMGGKVVNVMVDHKVYGKMEAELQISSRRNVNAFMEDMKSGKSGPLKNITADDHAHYIEAESEEILDLIEEKMREMGILRV